MSLHIGKAYEERLKDAKPYVIPKRIIKPPPGALGDIRVVPQVIIPPINTDIVADILPTFQLSKNPVLRDLSKQMLPDNFNWRHHGGKKSQLISKPGNQMLCGSCWAISTAGIVADNHVVAGTVDWLPNLSTTYSLACYPQQQCNGGVPALLFQDIAKNGISTNHCVDYSWCAENEYCNGKATKHFDKGNVDISAYIPNCGCYNTEKEHYLYFINNPETASIDEGGMNDKNFALHIKTHIYHYGPVQGGFLVYNNFRPGKFTNKHLPTKGIYLENGIYTDNSVQFQENYVNDSDNYIGSHAIAILGWGIEDNVLIDNRGTKIKIPYWYCRNSWTENWGNDDGYFKMAMYPYNKYSQFDKLVSIQKGYQYIRGGGMTLFKVTESPRMEKFPPIERKPTKFIHDSKYYIGEQKIYPDIGKIPKTKEKEENVKENKGKNYTILIIIIVTSIVVIFMMFLLYFLLKKYDNNNSIQYSTSTYI